MIMVVANISRGCWRTSCSVLIRSLAVCHLLLLMLFSLVTGIRLPCRENIRSLA